MGSQEGCGEGPAGLGSQGFRSTACSCIGVRPFYPRIHLGAEQGILLFFFFSQNFILGLADGVRPLMNCQGGAPRPLVLGALFVVRLGSIQDPPPSLLESLASLPLYLASGLGFLCSPSSLDTILGPLAALGSGREGVKGKLLGPLRESPSGFRGDPGRASCQAPSGSGADALGATP